MFFCNIKFTSSDIIYMQLAALAQMVTCLPLIQQVRGSIPGGVVNFNLKIFNLGAFREEQAISRHRVSPSLFLS